MSSRTMSRNVIRGMFLGVLLIFASMLVSQAGAASAAPSRTVSPSAAPQELLMFANVRHGMCLDASSPGVNGAPVYLYTCNPNAWWQRWHLPSADFTIRTPGSPLGPENRCLDAWPVSSAPGGWRVSMWECNGGDQQQWITVNMGFRRVAIRNQKSGLCLDTPWNGTGNGTYVTLYTCHHNANQIWTF